MVNECLYGHILNNTLLTLSTSINTLYVNKGVECLLIILEGIHAKNPACRQATVCIIWLCFSKVLISGAPSISWTVRVSYGLSYESQLDCEGELWSLLRVSAGV